MDVEPTEDSGNIGRHARRPDPSEHPGTSAYGDGTTDSVRANSTSDGSDARTTGADADTTGTDGSVDQGERKEEDN